MAVLASHRGTIDSAEVDLNRLGNAIKDAGCTPVVVDDVVGTTSKHAVRARTGCCCG